MSCPEVSVTMNTMNKDRGRTEQPLIPSLTLVQVIKGLSISKEEYLYCYKHYNIEHNIHMELLIHYNSCSERVFLSHPEPL